MSLTKNSIFNIIGAIAPIVVAIPALGYMARILGVERFGLFTLIFALVGYASLFDAGISRAVIRAIAVSSADEKRIKIIIGTSTWCVLVLSIVASILFYVFSENLTTFLSVSEDVQRDASVGLMWLSLSIPPLLLSGVWFAYLEGRSDFYKLNILRSITGVTVSILPLLWIIYNPSFTSAIVGLLVGRVITMIVAYRFGLGMQRKAIFNADLTIFKELVKFGGWVTISNIISPLMIYLDRFLISNNLGASSVAYYSIPAEAVTRFLLISQAVSRVIFTKLSANHEDAKVSAQQAHTVILFFSLIVLGIILVFSENILKIWMGSGYLGDAVVVFKILAIGLVFNSIAQVPYTKIQAAGYSRLTALIHLIEFFPYVGLLYYLVQEFGLVGAATAWVFRVLIDYMVLQYFSKKLHC